MKAAILIALLAVCLDAQVIRTVPYHLDRLDAGLDAILTQDSPLEVSRRALWVD